jgi:hypothetical protein
MGEMDTANRQARQDGRKMIGEEAIFANNLEQLQLVREAGSLSKQRRRWEKLPSQDERASGPFESLHGSLP